MRSERIGNLVHWVITLGLACVVTASSVIVVRLQRQIMRNNVSSYERDIALGEAHIHHLEQALSVIQIANNQQVLLRRELDKEEAHEGRF